MSEAEQVGASRQDDGERLLAGRYRLGGVLGRGGMGTVWRAQDETLGRTVAVKELRLPPRIEEDEKRRLITRTFREAKAIARIRNNSAVTVYDVVDEDNRPWIVMELVEGKSLAEVIREDGLLTPKRAAEVGLAILDVLRSAHREGILHRDVKPSNVLIADDDGRVVLTDFGIAQVEGDPSVTSTGMLVGAPSYISPERARGHKPGPAADLWSLGGLLYAAVEGVPPYDKGSAIATLTAVMTEPVEQPKNAGPLEKVIYGLLVKDPEQRLDDAGARAMLTEVINTPEPGDEPVDATKVVPLPDLPSESSSKKKSPGGGRKSEEPADGLLGALRSVRKGKGGAPAVAAAAAGAAGAGTAGAGAAADRPAEAPGGKTAAAAPASEAPAAAAPASESGAGSGTDSGTRTETGAGDEAGSGQGSGSGARSGFAAVAAGAGAATAPAAAKKQEPAASVLNSSAVGGSSGGSGGAPPRTTTSRASLTDAVSRRTLMIIAVVVALAVLGTVLAVTLGGGDDSGSNENKGGDGTSTSSGANAGSDTRQDENSGTDKGDDEKSDSSGGGGAKESSPSASATGESSGSGGGSNSGSGSGAESTHKDGQGFSIGLPKGWKYQSTSAAGARFAGPDGQKLLVGWTSTPKADPVADWKNQEQYMQRAQYQRIRIEKVDYRGWNTADWEFTYVESGTEYRSIDRGFVVNDSLGYGLMYTAKGSKWDTELRKETWRTLTTSFTPKS
ncbi:serine/threonine-protein kinase [Streptomyces sp. NPDC006285]|uniref:serine/threonine-protein kinase n=1 Tax=Streptomyces sp. NPDC006285 TaxID=3364742 RepID=UPI0036B7B21B